jgi:nucleotide-binding universal stress UspA family protein
MKTKGVRNVLVPVDFSKMSTHAIETAKRLAGRLGAGVHLAHIHHWQYPTEFLGPVLSAGRPVSFEEHQQKTLGEELKTLARKAGLADGATHLVEGPSAFHEICRLAKEIPADLIVMPTHGHTGFKHVFLGSTAERVVQHAPCPVLITRSKPGAKVESPQLAGQILVPVDFSKCSLAGLDYAIDFAARSGATRVILFHAVYPGYIYASDGLALYDLSSLEEAALKNAQRQMQEFVGSADFGDVEFETAIALGPPVAEICSFATDRDVDLIVTSTHGWTGLKHVLLGSTSEQIVRHAPCSVLVAPSHPDTRNRNLSGQSAYDRREISNGARHSFRSRARLAKTSRAARPPLS